MAPRKGHRRTRHPSNGRGGYYQHYPDTVAQIGQPAQMNILAHVGAFHQTEIASPLACGQRQCQIGIHLGCAVVDKFDLDIG